jgi:REP element-mobilizing transposase RayT
LLYGENGLVEITSRVQHGRSLLTPSPLVNELILGILGRAQAKYDVLIHAFIFMSNHYHLLLSVLSVLQMSRFVGFVNGNIAKELGRHYDWREKFWGRRYHSAPLGDDEANQLERFMYILANGCKEGLVASPLDWPGVTSAKALAHGKRSMKGTWYDRTAQFRALQRGQHELHPSTETVHLTPLPFLAERSEDEQRQFAVDAVKQIEEQTAEIHRQNGTEPLGARAIQRRNPHDKPKAFKPSPAPKFHAATPEEYWTMREARKAKINAYRHAAERLKEGDTDVRFPPGCFPPRLPYVEEERGPP